MKKKLLSFLLAFALIISAVPISGIQACASDDGIEMEDIDYSYLMTDDALVGYSQSQTRGYYLVTGTSAINKQSSKKIAAGGSTNAYVECEVAITVIVERLTDEGWARYTSWNVTKENEVVVMTSKILTVPTGYSYRVRCTHYAGTDISSSWTSALKM